MMMTRHEDWPDRLAAFLAARRNMPFAWGTQDCVTFAADGVAHLRQDGVDIIADVRGAYGTEEEADAILAARGGMDVMLADMAAAAGLASIIPTRAGRGDMVLARAGNLVLAGICNGSSIAVTGADGLQFLPRRAIIAAWAV